MQERELNDIASELKKAVDAGTQLNPISSRFLDFNISDAYSVSQIIHKRRLEEGWVPAGRKIGFTNSKMWSEYGVREPVWAYMYDRTVTHVSDNTQAQCFIGQYCEPKIEPEIVLHFCSTPSVGASPLDLLACVDWIALGFEIVQSHFPGWKFQAADTIADRGLHAELFIGEHRAVNQLGQNIIQDLERFEVALSCNSTLCELGYGLNVLGSPLIAIGHLISVLSKQHNAMPIQAGEIITTGTLTSAFSVSAGQIWSASVNGILLPALDIRFEI